MEIVAELEDGEIGDYSPVPRPELVTARTVSRIKDSSSDDADSDDSHGPKRPRLKCLPKRSAAPAKFNIWAENLQEQALTEKLGTCKVVTHDRSRDVESYFIPRLERCSAGASKRCHDGLGVKERLGPRPPVDSDVSEDEERDDARHLLELRVTAESTPEDVATDIANKLFEEKDDLVAKVVKVLGIEKTIKLFERTREIEADGGMMILNGARRRTPGGVFFYLTRTTTDATREQMAEMFEEDQRVLVEKRRRERAKKRQAAVARLRELVLPELPPLPTRGEIMIADAELKAHQAAASEDDEGEIKDTTDDEGEIKDATEDEGEIKDATEDVREESESPPPAPGPPLSSRELTSYDDDFLQVDTDMDIF